MNVLWRDVELVDCRDDERISPTSGRGMAALRELRATDSMRDLYAVDPGDACPDGESDQGYTRDDIDWSGLPT